MCLVHDTSEPTGTLRCCIAVGITAFHSRSIGLWRWYINITTTILDIIHRLIFYLNHTVDNVLTSQEIIYIYATSQTVYCDLWVSDYCINTIMDNVHHLVFCWDRNVSEIKFCLRLRVEFIHLLSISVVVGDVQRMDQSTCPNCIGYSWRRRQHSVSETPCFKQKNKVTDNYQNYYSIIFGLRLMFGVRARCSIVVKALCYIREGRGFETRWCDWFISIHLILPVALGPGVYSASNRNEYQKHKNNISWE
jgi:hypothetical protein